jgi:hypothetical protein
MSNKALCLPQLDKLEEMYQAEAERSRSQRKGVTDRDWASYVKGRFEAIKDFRSMLEGIDVTHKEFAHGEQNVEQCAANEQLNAQSNEGKSNPKTFECYIQMLHQQTALDPLIQGIKDDVLYIQNELKRLKLK